MKPHWKIGDGALLAATDGAIHELFRGGDYSSLFLARRSLHLGRVNIVKQVYCRSRKWSVELPDVHDILN